MINVELFPPQFIFQGIPLYYRMFLFQMEEYLNVWLYNHTNIFSHKHYYTTQPHNPYSNSKSKCYLRMLPHNVIFCSYIYLRSARRLYRVIFIISWHRYVIFGGLPATMVMTHKDLELPRFCWLLLSAMCILPLF